MLYKNGTGTQAKGIGIVILVMLLACALTACTKSTSMQELQQAIIAGDTAPDNEERLLVVDVRNSKNFIEGHIKDALSVPLSMIAQGDAPLYTNSYDTVSTDAATGIENSWLAHMLINQLVNDFSSTYENTQIVFYGATIFDGMKAAQIAKSAGYKNVSWLNGDYAAWSGKYSDLTRQYYDGVESADAAGGSFIMTGFINTENYDQVSVKGTWHSIVFKGGGMHDFSFFQSNMAPFCFQELLTYIGASPEGNMADGINISDIPDDQHNNGQQVFCEVTWDGAGKYYPIADVWEEKPSLYQPDPNTFEPLGIEPRIGGTRESSINWNSGCVFCLYSCTVGITSNAKTNQATWYADGGIYDTIDDPRNIFAGRFFPRTDILPGAGTPVKFKVSIMKMVM
jgi:rhodanese-related sulfurtransferase